MALKKNTELEQRIIDSLTYYFTNEKIDKIVNSFKKLARMDVDIMISIDDNEAEIQEEEKLEQIEPHEPNDIEALPGDIEGNLLAMGYSAEQIAYGLQRSSTMEGVMEAILIKYS